MTKAELIEIIAENVDDLSKADITRVYDAVFETIEKACTDDPKKRFNVNNFGTFELKERKERKGHNPATGQEMTIPAKTTMKFKPAGALEERLNKKKK